MYWHSEEQFLDILCHVTAADLMEQSKRAKAYFWKNHSVEAIRSYLIEDTSLKIPEQVEMADSRILEIEDQKRL